MAVCAGRGLRAATSWVRVVAEAEADPVRVGVALCDVRLGLVFLVEVPAGFPLRLWARVRRHMVFLVCVLVALRVPAVVLLLRQWRRLVLAAGRVPVALALVLALALAVQCVAGRKSVLAACSGLLARLRVDGLFVFDLDLLPVLCPCLQLFRLCGS